MAAPCSQWIACSPVRSGIVAGRSTRSLACMYILDTARIATFIGLAAVTSIVCVQLYFELAHCKGGDPLAKIIVGAIVLAPTVLFTFISWPRAAVVSGVVTVVPVIWAYRIECVLPYSGGGASMAFVPVMMFAVPAAFVVGMIVELAVRKRHAG